jgi:drug/metabolite transporter (DMT)-like permease
MSLIRIERNPSTRQLLVFGAAWLVFFGLWGITAWTRGRHTVGEALWVAAAVVPLAGAANRRFLRHAYISMSYLTYPVGYVVSHVILALVYFLALTPIGLTMRLFGRDPLSRSFEPGSQSYWKPRDKAKKAETYFNQS